MNTPDNSEEAIPDLSSDDVGSTNTSPPQDSTNQTTHRKRIGPYKILQKIAEGGMGAVYMAEQLEPIKRRVALKIIKAGIDSEQVVARFEAERQALAMMDHPNISKIFDAGTTDEGAPFFVMELVKGIPLTEYCDKNTLSVEERLQLFVPVCNAVQHAHMKGIIHRDLKPSNVLVALHDGVPVPKVIDFGLAKAIEHQTRLTDKTMFTEFGQVVGTLQYMSPEQAEMNQLDVDTRTDVYSLGVMLYELLTGSTPLDDQTMKQHALLRILELIREGEPPRPSTRLSHSGEAISSVSQQRKIHPSRLQQILRGELDWIVMKSLEKDRVRRYETATAFAEDVTRFLNDEAVQARPQSKTYRLKKTIRQNRAVFATGTIITSLLVAGSIGLAVFSKALADKNTELAENNTALTQANNRATIAKELAEKNEQTAKQQSQLALETLTSVIGDLQDGLKDLSGSGNVRKRLLETALGRLDHISTEYLQQTSVNQQTIQALLKMGDLVKEFGVTQSPDELTGESKQNRSAVQLAKQYYERAHEIAVELLEDDPGNREAMTAQSDTWQRLGDIQLAIGDIAIASDAYKESFDLRQHIVDAKPADGVAQANLAIAFERLGNVQMKSGQTSKSIDSLTKGLSIRKNLALANPNDSELQRAISVSHFHLGNARLQKGDSDAALRSFRAANTIHQRLAKQSPLSVQARRDLSISYDKIAFIQRTSGDAVGATQTYELCGRPVRWGS